MSAVLHLRKSLRPPVAREAVFPGPLPGLRIRPLAWESELDRWLELRRQAFFDLQPGVRAWCREDFEREIVRKAWSAEAVAWVAETADGREMAGTVSLARRGSGDRATAVVHWLAVLPSYRRQGIGRALIERLEHQCWDAGGRVVEVETHSAWRAATAIYRALGYVPASHVVTE